MANGVRVSDGETAVTLGAAFYPSEDLITTDQLARFIYAMRHNLREKIVYFILCMIVFRGPFGQGASNAAVASADELARISADPDLARDHLGANLPVLADMVTASVAQAFRCYVAGLMAELEPEASAGDVAVLAGADLATLERYYLDHIGVLMVAAGEARQKLDRLLAPGRGVASDEIGDPVALAENAITPATIDARNLA